MSEPAAAVLVSSRH